MGLDTLKQRPFRTAFVFDLDGTLIDSISGISAALALAFQSIGRVMPSVELRSAIGPPIRVIAKRLLPDLSDADCAAVESAYRPLYDEDGWRGTELFEGVGETLRKLHGRGHRLFIVTNKPKIPTIKILEKAGLLEIFEEVLTRDSVTPHYPTKVAMLRDLADRRGLSAAETVMVGDTLEDGEAAINNAMQFVFMTYGYGKAHESWVSLGQFKELLTIRLDTDG